MRVSKRRQLVVRSPAAAGHTRSDVKPVVNNQPRTATGTGGIENVQTSVIVGEFHPGNKHA